MAEAHPVIRLEFYAGHRGEESPRAVVFGDRRIEVAAVLDRWLAPDHRGFRVRGSDGNVYTIRHDVRSGAWDVTPFDRGL